MSDDVEGALVQELRAIAGGRGRHHVRDRPPRREDRDRLSQRLVVLLMFSAPYAAYRVFAGPVAAGYRTWPRPPRAPRPLKIELRRETPGNVKAKARGIDREVQTGDPELDREVYIDTIAPDEAVSFVLSRPEARAAARALLDEGFGPIQIDDDKGDVVTTLTSFVERQPRLGRGARIVDAFATLVRHLPFVEAHGPKPVDRGRLVVAGLGTAAGAGVLRQFITTFELAPSDCVSHDEPGEVSMNCIDVGGQNCCAPMGVGVAAGVPLGLLFGWLAARTFRGQSSSSARRLSVLGSTPGITVAVAIVVAQLMMWHGR